MSLEYTRVGNEALTAFYRATEREALKSFYEFSVIWHDQSYDFAAVEGDVVIGGATIRVAASLAHVERIVVAREHRRQGIARELLARAADVANYYNCHKMTVLVPHLGQAQTFFEACDYKVEAVLPQHTFKLDMAAMRKFLL